MSLTSPNCAPNGSNHRSPPSTRAATYEVIIQSLKHLPYTKLDAAFGLTGLVCLYIIRWSCEKLAKRYPARGTSYPTLVPRIQP